MKRDAGKLKQIVGEANVAKEHLAEIARKLEEAGYIRKAKSCMTLVYMIEEWQNKK